MLNTLQSIAEQTDCAMIYVTHHADEILPFFTHAMLLKDKTVHSQGEIGDIITAENLSDFLGAPAEVIEMNGHIYFKLSENMCMDKNLWNSL